MYNEVRPNGSASHIFKQMQNNKFVSLKVVLEYVYMQERGNMVWQFLTHYFGEVELLENFQSFFRFKILQDATLSRLFGEMEKQKKDLGISQYSIKQTTIEQIFINFAVDIEHDD
jgi:ATP-binding cassette subfamily A (ABC1) protein 3